MMVLLDYLLQQECCSSVEEGIYVPTKVHVHSTLPLKRFQCSSDRQWPSLIL